ncbi:uncharacterized protein J8A68_003377 [[Candida] subhashii]|uniref:Uncharacterized protein n=1 Tax=[Candida] subhashii TaxID=561895 RepID=A0A8J5QME6_9ASCO|nr:uncharacterized protein J8A68_003377 [[Candida] subhashii]KAG7663105.1 hypothetical protein J8A68_003377 [[Candida] subhashii]
MGSAQIDIARTYPKLSKVESKEELISTLHGMLKFYKKGHREYRSYKNLIITGVYLGWSVEERAIFEAFLEKHKQKIQNFIQECRRNHGKAVLDIPMPPLGISVNTFKNFLNYFDTPRFWQNFRYLSIIVKAVECGKDLETALTDSKKTLETSLKEAIKI